MSTITVEMTGAFTDQVGNVTPSAAMQELMSTEAERWRQMEQNSGKGRKSLLRRLVSLFRKG